MKRFLASIILAVFVLTACESESKVAPQVIPVKRETIADLVETLREAIRHGQHKTVQALYTQESAAAVARSIRSGIGTAGTIDESILLEFEDPSAKDESEIEVLAAGASYLSLRLPSGRVIECVLAWEEGWAINVLASRGGEILLLGE